MSDDPETLRSQRARRAAGWKWLKTLAPPDLSERVRQVASTSHLSHEAVIRATIARGLATISKQEWYAMAHALPFRLRRRDVGRRRARRGDRNAPEPPTATAPGTET
jgi:hypothetical protein